MTKTFQLPIRYFVAICLFRILNFGHSYLFEICILVLGIFMIFINK